MESLLLLDIAQKLFHPRIPKGGVIIHFDARHFWKELHRHSQLTHDVIYRASAIELLALLVVDISENRDVAVRAVVRAAPGKIDTVLCRSLPWLFNGVTILLNVKLVVVTNIWVW